MSLVFPKESLSAFPKHLTPGYKSTVKRSPSKPLVLVPHTLSELTGPVYGHDAVQEGDSAWRLGAGDERLIAELAHGFAGAVREMGDVDEATIAAWVALTRSGAIVGHADTLALPPAH